MFAILKSDSYSVKCDIKVIIPDELKKILANEHHSISALNKVIFKLSLYV